MKKLDELIYHSSEVISSKVDFNSSILAISNNSKDVRQGSLFFAISGQKIDGHNFIDCALRQKAAAVVVEKEEYFRNYPNTILVKSTRKALGFACSRWFSEPSKKMKIVAITGTNGKTTITYLFKHIWEKLGRTVGIIGTVEYLIGTKKELSSLTTPDPLTLQRLLSDMVKANVTCVAMEASSIALDQMRISGTSIDVGIFTNITQDHLDYHATMENYFKAKKKLFTELKPKHAVFNIDDDYGLKLFNANLVPSQFGYSLTKNGDFSIYNFNYSLKGTNAQIKTPYGDFEIHSSLIGKHNLYNILSVIAACYSLGDEFIPSFLDDFQAPRGRLEQVVTGEEKPTIFVDYAHTPDALRNVLITLSEIKSNGRIITVFGCGGNRDKEKRPKMGEVVSKLSDITIVTSDNPRMEEAESIINEIEKGINKSSTIYFRETSRKDAIFKALSIAQKEDVVIIAGKGHEDYQIIGTEKIHFDDREVVLEYYKEGDR